jgi:hypothetical protein
MAAAASTQQQQQPSQPSQHSRAACIAAVALLLGKRQVHCTFRASDSHMALVNIKVSSTVGIQKLQTAVLLLGHCLSGRGTFQQELLHPHCNGGQPCKCSVHAAPLLRELMHLLPACDSHGFAALLCQPCQHALHAAPAFAFQTLAPFEPPKC